MSQSDLENQESSEQDSSQERLVPVSEAIRYRKRAQSAESQAEELKEQLKLTKNENEKLTGRLSEIELDQKLAKKLSAAWAADLEALVLITKSRMTDPDSDVDSVIEQLKKEKTYLFDSLQAVAPASRTSGAKDKNQHVNPALEKAAKKAATSGNRNDVQEYMKVRGKFN